jgi:hypothetical protein
MKLRFPFSNGALYPKEFGTSETIVWWSYLRPSKVHSNDYSTPPHDAFQFLRKKQGLPEMNDPVRDYDLLRGFRLFGGKLFKPPRRLKEACSYFQSVKLLPIKTMGITPIENVRRRNGFRLSKPDLQGGTIKCH